MASSGSEGILFVLLGPTGVGKTEAAIAIARHLHTPVINADSRQLFKEIPIGTAAPTREQTQAARHYFVGCRSLDDYYSAAIYEQECLALIQRLFDGSEDGTRHQTALLSGGSMMYIDAVCNGIDDIPTVEPKTRELMRQRLDREGLPTLVEELRRLDYQHWLTVDRNNPRRVVHALEICHQTGRTYTSFRTRSPKRRAFRTVKVGLNRPREEMYSRINRRVLQMVDHGLEAEALRVYPKRGLNALNTVGYKEMFNYLDGLLTKDEAIRQIQSNTRQYMRKQLTWFKRDQGIKWFSPDNIEEILNYIDHEKNQSFPQMDMA